MRIRSQLIIVLSLLAGIPLISIVVYSYWTSLVALQAAEETEARLKVGRLEEKLGAVQEEFTERLASLHAISLTRSHRDSRDSPSAMARPLAERVLRTLGDTAPIVSRIEFVPVAPSEPEAPQPATSAEAGSEASEETPSTPPPAPSARAGGNSSAVVVVQPNPDGSVPPTVVDVQQIMRTIDGAIETAVRFEVLDDGELSEDSLGLETDLEALGWEMREVAAEIEGKVFDQAFDQAWSFGEEGFFVPVMEDEAQVGALRIGIGAEELAKAILSRPISEREGDLAFAFDAQGDVFVADNDLLPRVEPLARQAIEQQPGEPFVENEHIVVTTQPDPETGIAFGVARPLEPVLAGVRHAAVRNLLAGLGLVVVALFGVLPLARRMTRNLDAVIAGVERVSQGDLNVRVPVATRNEFGRLAEAVNAMAVELLDKEVRIVEQERRNQEQILRERLLQSDNARKTEELEQARRFQLSLLPKVLPDHPQFEVAVAMQTATEVGGDYYDFLLEKGPPGAAGELTLAIGDATGHGARAGTMVTVIKSLFSTEVQGGPADFLDSSAAAIRRMDLGRMLMALTVARFRPGGVVLSAAGMPPVFFWRALEDRVEEITLPGMPLGGMAWSYTERHLDLKGGDTLLFLSDGFPEATNGDGDPFGYERVAEAFRGATSGSPQQIIDQLLETSRQWRAGIELADDLTLVVVRAR